MERDHPDAALMRLDQDGLLRAAAIRLNEPETNADPTPARTVFAGLHGGD